MYERKRCVKIILKYPVRRNKSMKSFKKVLAVFLCAAMIVPGLCIGVYASDTCDCGNTPIVYMYGKQTIYLTREDGSKVNPLARDDLDIGGMVKEVVPDIAKSMATGNWDEYCEKVYNMLAPIWKDVKVDGNGHIMTAVSKRKGMDAAEQVYHAGGSALKSGIYLNSLFLGTGYNKQIRLPLDYGSDMYQITKEEEEEEPE